MTTNALDPLVANLDRRQLLTRALFGSVGAAATLAALSSEAEASDTHTLTFDVACDCRTASPGFVAGKRATCSSSMARFFPLERSLPETPVMIRPNPSMGSRRSATGAAAASKRGISARHRRQLQFDAFRLEYAVLPPEGRRLDRRRLRHAHRGTPVGDWRHPPLQRRQRLHRRSALWHKCHRMSELPRDVPSPVGPWARLIQLKFSSSSGSCADGGSSHSSVRSRSTVPMAPRGCVAPFEGGDDRPARRLGR